MKKSVILLAVAANIGFAAPVVGQSYSSKAMDAQSDFGAVAAPTYGNAGQGQWMTTADGCTYSRAQAPGYAPTWHLVINPHHVGQPNAHRGCKSSL